MSLVLLAALLPAAPQASPAPPRPAPTTQTEALCRAGTEEARVKACTELVAARPDEGEYRYFLGVGLYELKRTEEAVNALTEATRLAPGNADAHRQLGDALRRRLNERWAEACSTPTAVPCPAAGSEEFRQMGRRMADSYVEATRLRPGLYPEICDGLNEALASEKDLGIEIGRRMTGLLEKSGGAWKCLGHAFYGANRDAEALDAYKRATTIAPTDGDAHYWLATVLQGAERMEEAAQAFRKAISLNPSEGSYHYSLARVLEKLKRKQEAAGEYREAVRLAPENAEYRRALADDLLAAGKNSQAISEYREAVRRAPQDPVPMGALGDALIAAGQQEEGLGTLRKAIDLELSGPLRSGGAQWRLGNALWRLGRLDEAVQVYRDSINRDPPVKAAMGLSVLAGRLSEVGRLGEALQTYEEAISKEPNAPLFRFQVANVQEQLGRLGDAVSSLREAVGLAPSVGLYHSALARTLSQLRRWDEAEKEHRLAVRLQPNSASDQAGLGWALVNLPGRAPEALPLLREAVRLAPKEPSYHLLLAVGLLQLNRYEEAALSYREAIRLDPKDGGAQAGLGLTLLILNRASEAITPLREAVRLDPDDATNQGALAQALASVGRHSEATEAWEVALRMDPAYFDARPDERKSWEKSKEVASAMAPPAARPAPPARKEPRVTSGSAFFVTADGHLLTAAHVVTGVRKVLARTAAGDLPATVVKTDSVNDIAVLKVAGTFTPLPLGNSASLGLGSSVFTIGFPNIDVQGFEPKLTKGEINSLAGIQDDPRQFQMSAEVQPGNSGGPLVDERGLVIGLVVSKLDAVEALKTTGDLPQNVNYAVKISYARPLLDAIPGIAGKLAPVAVGVRPFDELVRRTRSATVLVLAER